MQYISASIRDLFIVLIGSDEEIGPPTFKIKASKARSKLYAWRGEKSERPARWFQSWTNIEVLSETFGNVFFNWLQMRSVFGPGFYLYIGTKRNLRMSIEHEFTNLAWGFEAFSRVLGYTSEDQSASEKRAQVLHRIEDAELSAWLSEKLAFVQEPTLKNRLIDLLQNLPFDIRRRRLKAFAKAFADLRNEMAHYGGPRHAEVRYPLFMQKVEAFVLAASVLYQARILQELGVEPAWLKRFVLEGGGHNFRGALEYVGLIDCTSKAS